MFTIDAKGLSGAQNLLNTIASLGSAIKGVELNARARAEGNSDKNNVEIADFLAETGRDFFSGDQEMVTAIEKAGLKEFEKELQKTADESAKGLPSVSQAKRDAQKVAAKAFIAAMEAAKALMVERIEQQRGANGSNIAELRNPDAKQAKYGFTHPIGKATGQLLDNLAPGKRNIKLRK